jgi:hypothetical protein
MKVKKTHFQDTCSKCVCRRNNTWNEVNWHNKKNKYKTIKSTSLHKPSKWQQVFSYWGIAQHTIVTRPVLPGNGPNCALPVGG